MPDEKNDEYIGALWEKAGAKGPFFSGKITVPSSGEVIDIILFRNTRKKRDNQPDWNILKQRQRSEQYKKEDRQQRNRQYRNQEPQSDGYDADQVPF